MLLEIRIYRTVEQSIHESHVDTEQLDDWFVSEQFEWSDKCLRDYLLPTGVDDE